MGDESYRRYRDRALENIGRLRGKKPSKADTVFAKVAARGYDTVEKVVVPQPYRATSLEQRMNESGGIKAGAHPQFDKPTPLDRSVATVKKAAGIVRAAMQNMKKKKGGKK